MSLHVFERISKRILRSCVLIRMMSSNSTVGLPSPSRISPCLILNSQCVSDNLVYSFHSLKKQKLVKWDKRGCGGAGGEVPAFVSKIVGSSHGWLALFSESNNDLFLSDPLNQRQIKLPSIETLPDPEINLIDGRGRVSKLILSCSPDDDGECRAMITYGVGDRLAFCSPSHSTHWTPIGDLVIESVCGDDCNRAKVYEDFVYCSKRRVFSSITPYFRIKIYSDGSISQSYDYYQCWWEDWDISPKLVRRCELPSSIESDLMPSWGVSMKEWPIQTTHLVYVEKSDQLFLVVRFLDGSPPISFNSLPSNRFSINDPYVIYKYGEDFAYKTTGFLVFEVGEEDGDVFLAVVNSLNDLAMFVGVNHSVAISTSEFPELNLKPNSIYFTDVGGRFKGSNWGSNVYGGLDVGIFDYENNVVSPCYEFDGSDPSKWVPLWFTPNIDIDSI